MAELVCANCRTPVKDLLEDRVPIYNPIRVVDVIQGGPGYRSTFEVLLQVDTDNLVCDSCLVEWWDYNEADNLIELVDPTRLFEPADLGEIEEALGLVGKYTGR